MKLYEEYGICIIPKGTKLFRKALTSDFFDTMFFAFTPYETFTCKHPTEYIQLWETLNQIQVLYMISKSENNRKQKKSSIVDIYKIYFPEEKYSNISRLEIKNDDLKKRDKLIDKFKRDNIFGWVTSVDDMESLEFFSFDTDENKNKNLKFIKNYHNKDNSIYDYDSTNKLIIIQ